jgi:purine-nucleoside phosphorylase
MVLFNTQAGFQLPTSCTMHGRMWTELALECARSVRTGLRLPAGESPVGVVLGSGLGGFAEVLEGARALAFSQLPGFPKATVEGHKGWLVAGSLKGVPVLVLQGRLHGYEGHDAALVAFPARLLGVLGARALVVTNAAGGANPSFAPGDLMRITDHINLTGRNPLIGPNEDALGPRFPDLSRAYDPRLAGALEEAAKQIGQTLRTGVYLQMTGPSYETPAEIRMARALGADAVGMSTVPEVIAAAHMGVPVAGISCITNLAAGIAEHPLTHQEVIEVARQAEGKFIDLLCAFLPRAFAAVPARAGLA